jgi:hypothetical protein
LAFGAVHAHLTVERRALLHIRALAVVARDVGDVLDTVAF